MSAKSSHPWSFALIALAALGGLTAPAAATPDDRTVTYQVHEDPAVPDSPVRLTFNLHIAPAARQGDAIGWRITSIEIAERGHNGNPDKVWRDPTPQETTEELWWVNHADPENPSPEEFIDLPQRVGTAGSVSGTGASLRYSLASNAAPDSETGGQEIHADYSLAFESAPETPIAEGEDEPVESSGGRDS